MSSIEQGALSRIDPNSKLWFDVMMIEPYEHTNRHDPVLLVEGLIRTFNQVAAHAPTVGEFFNWFGDDEDAASVVSVHDSPDGMSRGKHLGVLAAVASTEIVPIEHVLFNDYRPHYILTAQRAGKVGLRASLQHSHETVVLPGMVTGEESINPEKGAVEGVRGAVLLGSQNIVYDYAGLGRGRKGWYAMRNWASMLGNRDVYLGVHTLGRSRTREQLYDIYRDSGDRFDFANALALNVDSE